MNNPSWCPHNDCVCLSWRQCFCVGRLPVPVPHDDVANTHRWCLAGASDNGGVFDLQVNLGDLWNFVVLFDAVRRDEGRTPILGERHKPAPNTGSHATAPIVVCLCGSTRFSEAFREANLKETLEGRIVLSIGCDTKSYQGLGLTVADKENLDSLHLRKIDLADEVLILNVGGYIGNSTRRELDYAIAHGKSVRYLEPQRAGA